MHKYRRIYWVVIATLHSSPNNENGEVSPPLPHTHTHTKEKNEEKIKNKKPSKFAKYDSVPKLMIYSIPPICRQHVINKVFAWSSVGSHSIVDRTVGSASEG